jgi:V8-like Glu-specific endopeptidase
VVESISHGSKPVGGKLAGSGADEEEAAHEMLETEKSNTDRAFRERELAIKEAEIEIKKAEQALEADKWSTDRAFQERELATREADLELKRQEQASSSWKNPVVVAILAAAVAAAGNAVVAVVNGKLQRNLETQRAEQTRILEMIKTGDPDKAAANLEFLLKAGLISDPEGKSRIQKYLSSRTPGGGPALPTASGSFSGPDNAVGVSALDANNEFRSATRAVGQLQFTLQAGQQSSCTGFLVGKNLVLTAGHCGSDIQAATMELREPDRSFPIKLPPLRVKRDDQGLDYAILEVEGEPATQYGALKLAGQPPIAGEAVALILFRAGASKLIVLPSADCKISSIERQTVFHTCSSGGGSAGGPLLTGGSHDVVAVHWGRDPAKGGMATSVTAILADLDRNNPDVAARLKLH